MPVPWRLVDAVGQLRQMVSTGLLGGRLRTPELLDHRRREARWKPLVYPNDKAHRVLGWRSAEGLSAVVRQAVNQDGAAGPYLNQ